MQQPVQPSPKSSPCSGIRAEQPQRVRSNDLMRGARRLVIEHGEATYTLLLTRNDKLILVK